MTSLSKTADIYIIKGSFHPHKIFQQKYYMYLKDSLSKVRLGTVKVAGQKHAEAFQLFFS